MVFIKEESEDVRIEDTFRLKHEDVRIEDTFRLKHEDVKTKDTFTLKHEDVKTKDTFRLKHEDIKTKDTFRLKHEDVKTKDTFRLKHEDVRIEDTFRLKHEDVKTEEKFRVKKEETEEQRESEDVIIEGKFRVKQEETEEQRENEESDDVNIEETFRVSHEGTEEQTGRRIYIIGDSYIRHGEKRAKETIGKNLGLDAEVQWFGCGGLVWKKLLPFFHQCIRRRPVPDFLLIHCGGNDLGITRSVKILEYIKQDLQELHSQFPQMKIIFSAITKRNRWRSDYPFKLNRARCFINNVMINFVLSIGGRMVHHPQIKHEGHGHFMVDGVKFTPLGNDLFLNNITQCLKYEIQ